MTKNQKWFLIICFVLGSSLGILIAQQQQSGGSGGGPVTQSGTWTVQIGNTPNTTPILATINQGSNSATVSAGGALKVDNSAVTQPVSGTVSINAIPAGTNVIGKDVPITSCGTTVFSQALVAIPTVSTAVTATTTCVYAITVSNTNASSQTVTITDNQGSPLNAVGPAYVIPALSQITFPFNGIAFTSGIKWNAGGTGVNGGILGVQ
jgi:hypothetical protein